MPPRPASKIVRVLKACKALSLKLGLPTDPTAPIHLTAYTVTGAIDGALMPMRPHDPLPSPAPSSLSVVDETHVSLTDTDTGEVLFEGSGSDLQAAAGDARKRAGAPR